MRFPRLLFHSFGRLGPRNVRRSWPSSFNDDDALSALCSLLLDFDSFVLES